MSSNIVYEGRAKSPRYAVEWGSAEDDSWRSKGSSYSTVDDAKAEARKWEEHGYDTRVRLVKAEKN